MANNNQIYKMSNAGGFKSLTRYYDMLAGNPAVVTNSYESIMTTTVGSGGTSSITFSSIPSDYKHLQIRGILKETVAQNWSTITLNGDSTSSNYRGHQLNGNGSTASASDTTLGLQYIVGTGEFGSYITDILDYTNTNKNTTLRSLGGVDQNGSGQLALSSMLWMNTAAVNQITVTAGSGVFVQYSQLALYGIKG